MCSPQRNPSILNVCIYLHPVYFLILPEKFSTGQRATTTVRYFARECRLHNPRDINHAAIARNQDRNGCRDATLSFLNPLKTFHGTNLTWLHGLSAKGSRALPPTTNFLHRHSRFLSQRDVFIVLVFPFFLSPQENFTPFVSRFREHQLTRSSRFGPVASLQRIVSFVIKIIAIDLEFFWVSWLKCEVKNLSSVHSGYFLRKMLNVLSNRRMLWG